MVDCRNLEENGMIERFFRSLKEECVWQQQFASFEELRSVAGQWLPPFPKNVRIDNGVLQTQPAWLCSARHEAS